VITPPPFPRLPFSSPASSILETPPFQRSFSPTSGFHRRNSSGDRNISSSNRTRSRDLIQSFRELRISPREGHRPITPNTIFGFNTARFHPNSPQNTPESEPTLSEVAGSDLITSPESPPPAYSAHPEFLTQRGVYEESRDSSLPTALHASPITAGSATSASVTPTLPPAPRTPHRSMRIYNDSLPRHSQPQTPIGLPRHGIPRMPFSATHTAPRFGRSAFSGDLTQSIHAATPTRAQRTRQDGRAQNAVEIAGLIPAHPLMDSIEDQENASLFEDTERRRIAREAEMNITRRDGPVLLRTPPRDPAGRNWQS
jgi:hypothetical protein